MTVTQKIIAAHAERDKVSAGELLEVAVDLVLANDVTAPVSIAEIEKLWQKTPEAAQSVFDKEKIALVLDHFVPNKDINSAGLSKTVRDFANRHSITHFYDVGETGVEHALLPEKGLVTAGDIVIGADSHTCTYGALGAFSTGMGSTDIAFAMLTGKTWLKVPESIKITLSGRFKKYVTGKDLVLEIIRILGVDGALYESLEFASDVSALSIDDRFTVANMAIECGAKNAVFPVDSETLSYLAAHGAKPAKAFTADKDASYIKEINIDLSTLSPIAAYPHLPSNGHPVTGITDIKIDQVVIGSCTNGRISDMRQAAEILNGRKVKKGVRLIIIPATQDVFKACIDEGLMKIFALSGAAVSTPTCGPCLGGHLGILAAGEKCVATTNRNFVGRMGASTSEVYLASPYVAAASAVQGFLASPDSL